MKKRSAADQEQWDANFAGDVDDLVSAAQLYRDQLSADRVLAMKWWNGDMEKEMPAKTGWSAVVSRDIRATIKKVLPSLYRTILGNEIICEYSGQNEDDQEGAEQITDFINLVELPASKAHKAIYDAMHDACLIRNGILYVGIEDKVVVTGSAHRGLDEFALAKLLEGKDGEEIEVIEGNSYEAPPEEMPEQSAPPPDAAMASPGPAGGPPMPGQAPQPEIMAPQPGMPMPGMPEMPPEPTILYDVKVKRTVKKSRPVMLGVPPEEFLIHPDATDAQVDSPIVGREMRMSRSDLIAMGYDYDLVMSLPAEAYSASTDNEKFTRRNKTWMQSSPDQKELEMVTYFDLYVRLDYDDDGIAELRHVCAAGDLQEQHILVNEYADFVRYFDIVVERRPHQWEGVSIADDVLEIQRVKTALMRYAMDNTYNVIAPQKAVNVDKLKNPNNLDAVMNPEPGRPIFLTGVDKASDAISYDMTPYVADKAMLAVQYWDKQIVERTGIDDSSAGLPPDALQNVTAKASALLEQKGIAQTELMVSTVAACLEPVFAAFLKLTIQCNDKARMVRLRDKFVEIDPRTWDADMDVNINTGLGAGTRERDMLVMGQIMQLQKGLIDLFGPESPILKSDNIYAAVEKTVQAAGIKSVGKFFTKPDPEEVAAAMKAAAEKPSPEMEKVNAQIKLMGEQSKMNAAKEQAQAQADLIVERAKTEAQIQIDQAKKIKDDALEFQAQMIERYKIDQDTAVKREKIQSDERIAEANRKNDLEKAQAGDLSKTVLGIKEENEKPAKDAGPKLAEVISELKDALSKMNAPRKIKRDPKTGDIIGMEVEAA